MAWVAVDKDGTEAIFERKPQRTIIDSWEPTERDWIILEDGSIEKLLGYKLTWEDEPVEI